MLNIAVIGGGVFGVMTAISLAEAGHGVTLFERLSGLLHGASQSGNRLHLGFHYPRHDETVRQCVRGYERFRREFGEAILKDVTNAYFIASEGSLTPAGDFLAFCDRHGFPYREIDPAGFATGIENVDLGVLTSELMYDPAILRGLMIQRLARCRASIRLRSAVSDISRKSESRFAVSTEGGDRQVFDGVVNCAYANANRISAHLGYPRKTRQYEYTAIPIVELDGIEKTSVTIMDGPFFSLLPFGSGGDHLLFHVDPFRRCARGRAAPQSANGSTRPPRRLPRWTRQRLFETIRTQRRRVHALLEERPGSKASRKARARCSPMSRIPTRARRSSRCAEPGYVEVFSGKVDHCMWVGDEVASLLRRQAAEASALDRAARSLMIRSSGPAM